MRKPLKREGTPFTEEDNWSLGLKLSFASNMLNGTVDIKPPFLTSLRTFVQAVGLEPTKEQFGEMMEAVISHAIYYAIIGIATHWVEDCRQEVERRAAEEN